MVVQFNEDVATTVDIHTLYLIKDGTEGVPIVFRAMQYDANARTARYTFPGYANGRLPAGSYTARSYISDTYGNQLEFPTLFAFTVAPPPTGDFNGDGGVTAADLPVWRNGFGSSTAGDADADGDTDGNDFLAWQRRLGQSNAAPANQQTTAPTITAAVTAIGGRPMERPRARALYSLPAISDFAAARDEVFARGLRVPGRAPIASTTPSTTTVFTDAPRHRPESRPALRETLSAPASMDSETLSIGDVSLDVVDIAFASS
jgi:hypothetical protein